MVDRFEAAEMQGLIEHLGGGQVAPEAHLAGRAEGAGERAAALRGEADRPPPVAEAHQHCFHGHPVAGAEQGLDGAVARAGLVLDLERREGDPLRQPRAKCRRHIRHLGIAVCAPRGPRPDLARAKAGLPVPFERLLQSCDVHRLQNTGVIDLRSDTKTQPSRGMREAMANAEVGDEQRREDPTVNELERRVAELLGQEEAVYVPTATMANEIALRTLAEPSDELIAEENAHLFLSELGGPAVHAGLMTRPIRGQAGRFGPDEVQRMIRRGDDTHTPRTRVVAIENTHNASGGRVWPLEEIRALVAACRELELSAHLDGARVLNAAGVPVDLEQVQTNFVQVNVGALDLEASDALARLAQEGVGFSATAHPGVLRAVTHLDIDDDDIEQAIERVPRALGVLARA